MAAKALERLNLRISDDKNNLTITGDQFRIGLPNGKIICGLVNDDGVRALSETIAKLRRQEAYGLKKNEYEEEFRNDFENPYEETVS